MSVAGAIFGPENHTFIPNTFTNVSNLVGSFLFVEKQASPFDFPLLLPVLGTCIGFVLTFSFSFLSSFSPVSLYCCLVLLSRSFSSWSSKRTTPPVIKLTKPTETVSKDPRNNVSDRPKVWTQNLCVIKDGPRETTRLDKKQPTRR